METRAARAAAALRAAFVEVESGVCGECVDALTDAQLVEWVKDPDNLGRRCTFSTGCTCPTSWLAPR